MIKIYLDQKDYIRIAQGLLGKPGYESDIKVYNYLVDQLKLEKIIIYFSFVHLYEAMKYDEEGSESLNLYCEIIDNLTRGNCIIKPNDITKRELELYLSKRLNFPTELSKETYPYGMYGEAFSLEIDSGSNLKEQFIKSFKEYIFSQKIPNKHKKFLIKQIDSPKKLRKILRERLNESQLKLMSRHFPGTEKMSKDDIINMLTSSNNRDEVNQFARSIFSFKNLVTYYRTKFPELKKLSQLFEEPAKALIQLINNVQLFHTILNSPPHLEGKLFKLMRGKSLQRMEDYLKELSKIKHFSLEQAKKLLIDCEIEEFKSDYVFIMVSIEYYKRHKGKLGKATKPKENDLMDIFHIGFMPYVQCLLCDKRFAEFTKNISPQFKTNVLKNLQELKSYLEEKIY
jgi:hypothetical protein